MLEDIGVNPSTEQEAVPVITDKIQGKHVPIYKVAVGEEGEVILVSLENAMPVTLGNAELSRRSNDSEIFVEILNQLKILNLYMAEGFNFTFTEENIEDDHDY